MKTKNVEAVTLITYQGAVWPAAYVVGEGWYRGPSIYGAQDPLPRKAYDIHLQTVTSAVERHGIDCPAWTLHWGEIVTTSVLEECGAASAVCEDDECRCQGISCEDYYPEGEVI